MTCAFTPPEAVIVEAPLLIEATKAPSEVASGIKTATEYLSNKEFNEQKIIEEILLEEDEFK